LKAGLHCSLPTALLLTVLSCAAAAQGREDPGHQQALDKIRGNCADCHQFPNDPRVETRATVGPPLSGIAARFTSRVALANLVKEPMAVNPDTIMPPYGRHRILTEREIDAIVDYLYTQ
jgi:L-cysteine S-thiosulfotransferase